MYCVIRFEIEKKLREAKRKESQRHKLAQTAAVSASQRSKDRRKVIEDKKDNKKMSALQDLKARREEKKKLGKLSVVLWLLFSQKYLEFLASVFDNLCVHSSRFLFYNDNGNFQYSKLQTFGFLLHWQFNTMLRRLIVMSVMLQLQAHCCKCK